MASFLGVTYTYAELNRETESERANTGDKESHKHHHKKGTKPITLSNIQAMPAEWRTRLRTAATKVNGREVSQLLEEVPAEHQAIALHLRQLVEDFSFEEIVRLSDAQP